MSLPTTTFSKAVLASDIEVYLTSTSGVRIGTMLSADVEIMRVVSLGPATIVQVLRGQEGTAAVPHDSGATVQVGAAVDFNVAPLSSVILGTTPDRTTTVVAQDSTPSANTTTTPIASVTS
jgi:hypothetical protein